MNRGASGAGETALKGTFSDFGGTLEYTRAGLESAQEPLRGRL